MSMSLPAVEVNLHLAGFPPADLHNILLYIPTFCWLGIIKGRKDLKDTRLEKTS